MEVYQRIKTYYFYPMKIINWKQKSLGIALYDCIDHLPDRSREVLLLHRVKGLKQKEISEKLSISVKTIKNQIWMSLQKLKECLEMKEV